MVTTLLFILSILERGEDGTGASIEGLDGSSYHGGGASSLGTIALLYLSNSLVACIA